MKISARKKLPKPSWLTDPPNLEPRTLSLKQTKPKIIAAIPAYNEERSIAKVIIKAKKNVDKVIVIDDGSEDATSEIAEALGAVVFRHTENLGYGAAIQTCFKAVKELNTDIMVILDGDGQHNPGEIPPLVKKIREGFDVVIGSRFLEKNKIPKYRKFGINILNLAIRRAGVNVNDCQSGYRAYSKKAIEQIHLKENGMPASAEILLQTQAKGLKFCEVPIGCDYGVDHPSTQNPFIHGATVLISILRHIEFSRPLQFFGLIGILFLAGGIAMGVWVLRNFNASGSLPFGPTLIMFLLIILGVFTIYTGIMLHAMARLWSKEKK